MPQHPQEHSWAVRLANLGRSEVPSGPPVDGPPQQPHRLEVFGAGPDWVQVTWSALGPGEVTVRCGDHVGAFVADGGPGSHLVEGLQARIRYEVVVSGAGIDDPMVLPVQTLARPPGEELLRIATISDVHIGSHSTGYLHTMVEIPEPDEPHPLRCLRAALDELAEWGAQHLVIKGDLVDRSDAEPWARAASALGPLDLPIEVLPGNHERSKTGEVDPGDALRAMGLDLVDGVRTVDHGGVRIVMADVTRPGTDWGTTSAIAGDLVAAVAVDGPVLLALHQQPMRFRLPTYLPVGLPGPDIRPTLARVAAANPRVLVTSGHTHRHRRHRIAGLTATEVGSTKDFPGTWAGYHVHEGGIVQVVRRIAEPSCIRWTDHTRRAAGGVWGHWAPGPLHSRCFSLSWPETGSSRPGRGGR